MLKRPSLVGPLLEYIGYGFYSHDAADMSMPSRRLCTHFHNYYYTLLNDSKYTISIDERYLFQNILFLSSFLYHAFTNAELQFFSTHKYVEIMDYEHLWVAYTKAAATLPTKDKKSFVVYLENNLEHSPLRNAEDGTFFIYNLLKEIVRLSTQGVFHIDLETDSLIFRLGVARTPHPRV